MEEEKNILFISEDNPFINKVRERIDGFADKLNWNCTKRSNYSNINSYLREICLLDCDLIILDLTDRTSDQITLAQFLRFESTSRKRAIICLIDQLTPVDIIRRAQTAGLVFIFVKGLELTNLIFTIGYFLNPKKNKDPKMAEVKGLTEEVSCFLPGRIDYITKDYLFIESHAPVRENEDLEVCLNLFGEETDHTLKVIEEVDSNFVYNYHHNFKLSTYFEEVEEQTHIDELKGKEKKTKIQETDFQKDIKYWIRKNSYGIEKIKSTILLFDSNLSFLKENYSADICADNVIRQQRNPLRKIDVLHRLKPMLIILQINDEEPNMLNMYYSNLIKKISSIENYEPYLFIFGETRNHLELAELGQYKKLLIHSQKQNLENITKLLKMYSKKNKTEEDKEVRSIISKRSDYGDLLIKFPITIKSFSQSIFSFTSTRYFHSSTRMRLHWPIELEITTIRNSDGESAKRDGKEYTYLAIVNGLNDENMAKLRRQVNKALSIQLGKDDKGEQNEGNT